MNVVQVLNVKLQRADQNVSWGFNVQGGKEFNLPLVIQRVTPNSLADRCSIRPGDFILRVGNMSTEHLTHNQSRDSIVRQGNNLELTLQRGAPPRPEDYQAKLDFPQHQLMTPENIEPKTTLSPQVGVQLAKNKALLTQSYNSPMGLYSSQNIADTLVSSIKNFNINDPKLLNAAQSIKPSPISFYNNNNNNKPAIAYVGSPPKSPNNIFDTDLNTSSMSIKLSTNPNLKKKLSVDYQPQPQQQQQLQQQQQQQHQHHHQQQHQQFQQLSHMPIQSSFYNQFNTPQLMSPLPPASRPQQQQQQLQFVQQQQFESRSVSSQQQQHFQQSSSSSSSQQYAENQFYVTSPHPSRPVSSQPTPQILSPVPQQQQPAPTPQPPLPPQVTSPVVSRPQSQLQQQLVSPIPTSFALSPVRAPSIQPAATAPIIQPKTGPRNPNFGAQGSAVLNVANPALLPNCNSCHQIIRGPFISAIGKIWCPNHFICAHPACGINLENVGFVEEDGKLYCERDFEAFLAPVCFKCKSKILADCCNALDKHFHPECFVCAACKQKIGTGSFHLEDGAPYCEKDYTKLFSTKCAGCDFPIEAGDKFFEALSQNWHVECFTCQQCHVPLHNTGFAAKSNKPYCKKHAY